jgi:hypothetical protein
LFASPSKAQEKAATENVVPAEEAAEVDFPFLSLYES